MRATFRRPQRYLNDGVPDFERRLALDGTSLLGSVKSGLLVDVVSRGSLVEEAAGLARAYVRHAVTRRVAPHSQVSAGIVTAILIGDRTGLPDDVRDRLQAAGTYHVIAISGGNIAILAAMALALTALLGIRGRTAALLVIVVLLAYAQVVTAGPSVWRATLMAVLYFAARALDHRAPSPQVTAVAAAMMLVARPLDVRDPGFILTFGATAALLEGARWGHALGGRHLVLGWLLASMVASLSTEAALLPVSAQAFSRVTAAGIVLNPIAVPLMGIVQAAGMALVLCDPVDALASAAAALAHMAAAGLVGSARLVEVIPWLASRIPPPGVILVLTYYFSLLVVLWTRRRDIRAAGALTLAMATLAIASGVRVPVRGVLGVPHAALRLTLFDVGQGEAMLVQPPDGRALLVDTGGSPFAGGAFDIGARVLAPALWARGVGRLDALLVTHGDPDHLGGAESIVADFAPRQLWEGIRVPAHVPMRRLLAAAEATGAAVISLRAGDTLTSGGARIRVLHPPAPDWERQRVRNDDSVVLEVLYGDVALLLTGDVGAAVERSLPPQLSPARIRVLKVGHHGSRTSTSRELLEGWRPQVALISSGRGNTFGHPAPEVLQRLESIGATVLRTDRHGQITLGTDGQDLEIKTFAPPSSPAAILSPSRPASPRSVAARPWRRRAQRLRSGR
jgi:competence protein ComEC